MEQPDEGKFFWHVQRFNCIAGGCAGTVSSWTCQLFLVCRIVHHHGVQLDYISVFCVAIGLVTGIPVIALLFAHSVFGKTLSDAAQPSLMILMAPFGMGYITYSQTFSPDNFTALFINAGIFIFFPVAAKVLHVMRTSPFRMGWWASSFPTMAFANGLLHYSVDHPALWTQALAIFLLLFGTTLILYLSFKTLWAAIHKTLWKLY